MERLLYPDEAPTDMQRHLAGMAVEDLAGTICQRIAQDGVIPILPAKEVYRLLRMGRKRVLAYYASDDSNYTDRHILGATRYKLAEAKWDLSQKPQSPELTVIKDTYKVTVLILERALGDHK